MKENQQKKLLIVGATRGAVHVRSFYFLVKDYFDDVLIACNEKIDFCNHRVLDFSVKNPFKIFTRVKNLRKIIDEFAPDVIHIHQANTLAFIVTRANHKKIPTVLTCWGSDVLLLPHKSTLMKKMVSYCLKKSTAITVDADYMKDAVIRLAGRKDTVVVNFGIELAGVEIPVKEKIIYSNRLHKELYKIDAIINAFSEFVKDHKGWKLIIGANGEQTSSLQALAAKILPEESYGFIGFVDAPTNRGWYLKSHIWVSVPESDGTSISLLEAMGYGCIPVVSDLPANREWITDNQNGCLVKQDLPDALKRALKLDLDNVQKRNSDIVNNRATKEANRKIFYSIYNNILARG